MSDKLESSSYDDCVHSCSHSERVLSWYVCLHVAVQVIAVTIAISIILVCLFVSTLF